MRKRHMWVGLVSIINFFPRWVFAVAKQLRYCKENGLQQAMACVRKAGELLLG